MEILKQDDYRIIHLTDGELIPEAVNLINNDKADGINFNFIRNFPLDINGLKNARGIKSIQINDYPPSWDFDYSIINDLTSLERLYVYTTDKKEINFQNYPYLKEVALYWRPKAKSIYLCSNLQGLFIGKYTEKDLLKFELLNNLDYIRVNTGSINSLNGIEALQNLSILMLMQVTSLTDISGIDKLPRLDKLVIDNCRNIKNINLVKNCKSVTKLNIVGTTPKI
jgi:hypothetical protein